MKVCNLVILLVFGPVYVSAIAQQASPCGENHITAVNARGDQGMGFSHEKTTHNFYLLADGCAIARRELLPVLMVPSNRFEFESESIILAARLEFRLCFVPIRTIYTDQQSKIRPLQDTMRYLRLIRKYRHASGSPK